MPVIRDTYGATRLDVMGMSVGVIGIRVDVMGIRVDVMIIRVDVMGIRVDVMSTRVDVVGIRVVVMDDNAHHHVACGVLPPSSVWMLWASVWMLWASVWMLWVSVQMSWASVQMLWASGWMLRTYEPRDRVSQSASGVYVTVPQLCESLFILKTY